MDDTAHAAWLDACLQVVCEVADIPREKVFLKLRQRQKGISQYERFSHASYGLWAQEAGLSFWVNLTDYLDTGLFLDHRITRSLFREDAAGKKVLNLFAYTGSFSVHAAAGGAAEVETVDMSQTYLSWAEKNMIQNGFKDPARFTYTRADILQWLPAAPKNYYDLVILDPPTFSNSKMMRDILDIQRDHVSLLNDTLSTIKPGGILYFSNNFRQFDLDRDAIYAASVKDITAMTIPPDFRNKKIHHCFKIVR